MRRIIHPDWIWVTYNLAPWRLDRKYLTCIGLLVLCTIQIVQAWLPADPTEREGRLRGLEEHPPRIPVRRHPQHQLITFYLQLPRPTMGGKSSLQHAQEKHLSRDFRFQSLTHSTNSFFSKRLSFGEIDFFFHFCTFCKNSLFRDI